MLRDKKLKAPSNHAPTYDRRTNIESTWEETRSKATAEIEGTSTFRASYRFSLNYACWRSPCLHFFNISTREGEREKEKEKKRMYEARMVMQKQDARARFANRSALLLQVGPRRVLFQFPPIVIWANCDMGHFAGWAIARMRHPVSQQCLGTFMVTYNWIFAVPFLSFRYSSGCVDHDGEWYFHIEFLIEQRNIGSWYYTLRESRWRWKYGHLGSWVLSSNSRLKTWLKTFTDSKNMHSRKKVHIRSQ